MDKQRMTPSLGGTQSSQIHSDRRVAVKMANFIMYISSQLKFKKKNRRTIFRHIRGLASKITYVVFLPPSQR